MSGFLFFDRDISWLSFNERILMEAAKEDVPLLERFKFLAIFSSNLDEFYRVRMPALMALRKIDQPKKNSTENISSPDDNVAKASAIIRGQQKEFGRILTDMLIPKLLLKGWKFFYNEPIPDKFRRLTTAYFFTTIASSINIIPLRKMGDFFPENNKLYLAVTHVHHEKSHLSIINIPSDVIPRFYSFSYEEKHNILFIDDIIKENLQFVFPDHTITGAFCFKVTRDAALNLLDEYEGDLAEKIKKQITKRDFGLATRFLYQPTLPEEILKELISAFNLTNANIIAGGNYHNLKDFLDLPIKDNQLQYHLQEPIKLELERGGNLLYEELQHKDILINTPFQSYETVLRFFNEAALDGEVEEIYTTLYRVAIDSRIVKALITAAKNGKTVKVFVELKARFDEANNIKWAKRMKNAGVKIIYTIPGLKVHAKIALVKRRQHGRHVYFGLLATGNMNESTALYYTDHILLTSNRHLLREVELLFIFLSHGKKPERHDKIKFTHLLVAPFNLQQRFLQLIDNEIANARSGLPANVVIKLNNLEEEILISKLYEASNAGVKVTLIVRSVCRLVAGRPGMSENITVKRIVDRYLEHGRIFLFENNGEQLIFLGSSDWMNRNIYRRIEVCFPVYDAGLKKELETLLSLQLQDNQSAVSLDENLHNSIVNTINEPIRSQTSIYAYFATKINDLKHFV